MTSQERRDYNRRWRAANPDKVAAYKQRKKDKASKKQSEIIHEGRLYISRAEYMKAACYSPNQITKALAAGIPHIVRQHGKQLRQYFNLEDCGIWHLRGHLETQNQERAG